MIRATLLLAAAALLALAPAARAQGSCPGTKCDAYFANAQGGPVDCCKHNYAATSKCWWGGTPVSWTQPRTCSQDGKTYSVLVKSNFQGPPTNAECRCQDPVSGGGGTTTLPSFSTLSVCYTLQPKLDQDIAGSDVACGGNSFCKVCGGLEAVKSSCTNNPRCVAFTYEAATGCGYQKGGATLTSRSGWVSYVRG